MVEFLIQLIPFLAWGLYTARKGISATGKNAEIFWVGLSCMTAVFLIASL